MRGVAIVSGGVVVLTLLGGAYLLSRSRTAAPAATSAAAAGRVIFRKAVAGGKEVVVRRGPTVGVSTIEGLVDARSLEQWSGVFPVWLEVANGPGQPLVLWSRLVVDFNDENMRGFAVLDLMPDGDWLVVAAAEAGQVFIYRVRLADSTVESCVLRNPSWSNEVAIVPLDETSVKLVLRPSPDGKGVVAEVTDLRRANPKGTVVFRQVGDTWAFEPWPGKGER